MTKGLTKKILVSLLFSIICLMVDAQTFSSDSKYNIHLKNKNLPEVLQELTAISGAKFSYNPDKIDAESRFDVDLEDKTITEILQSILPQMKLDFFTIENKIVIKKSRERAIDKESQVQQSFYTLSGFVSDLINGEVLIGASISIPGTSTGTTSNEYGFYSIRLPAGTYSITYAYLGYQKTLKSISLFSDTRISAELVATVSEIEEIVIHAEDFETEIKSTQTSGSVIKASSISEMPAFMGESDVIKSLQTLPGIKFFGEGSTLFYVRGGNRDQNLILVDEAILYNPSHMLGLFSSLSPGSVNSIKIYKGDIPAEYGGRLSSLIDIKTKEGNLKAIHFSGNTGLFATGVSLEGPISKDKSSYFISARHSQLKWLLKKTAPNLQDLYFTDVTIKFNIRLNENNRVFFSSYSGKDKYLNGSNSNASGIQWENVAGTLRWNHIFNEKLFSNLSFTGSRYDYDFITSSLRNEMWNSHISNFSLKTDFTWFRQAENTLKFGFLLGNYYFNPGNFESGVNPNPNVPKVPQKNTREQALYFSSEQEISDVISMRFGARLSGWSNVGEAIEVVYNQNKVAIDTNFYPSGKSYNHYLVLEPRFSIRFMLSPKSSIKTAFSRTSQFVNLVSNSISPFTSMEVWLPSSLNIKPQICEQFVVGYQQYFAKDAISFSIEGFYKKMHNQIDYTDHAQMLFNPYIDGELVFGDSRSAGIELMLSKTQGGLTGWMAYTLSTTKMQFPGINNGMDFPSIHDRPHVLSINGNYKIKPRWDVSASWIIMSGGTYTSPSGFYVYNNYQIPIYEFRNNERLPVYHRLDLSTELHLNKTGSRYEHKLKFSLFNAYGHKNPFAINFNKIQNEDSSILVAFNHEVLPELVNTMTYLFGLIPSFSYSFNF